MVKNDHGLRFGMFRQAAWAVGNKRSGLTAARTVETKSSGGFYRYEWSPCTKAFSTYLKSEGVPVVRTGRVVHQRPRPPDERTRVLDGRLRGHHRRRRREKVSASALRRGGPHSAVLVRRRRRLPQVSAATPVDRKIAFKSSYG